MYLCLAIDTADANLLQGAPNSCRAEVAKEREGEKDGELNLLNKLNKKLRKDLNGAHMNVVKRGLGSARAVDLVTQIYTVPLEPKIINTQVFRAINAYKF